MKDNGVKAIEMLMEKKGKFDYILLETTGIADPGPVASIFWLDEELGNKRLFKYLTGYPTRYCLTHFLCNTTPFFIIMEYCLFRFILFFTYD